MADNDKTVPHENDVNFGILRIYVKDLSFEAPNTPQIFLQEFKPAVDIKMDVAVTDLKQDIYEVTLTITITTKDGDKTGFLVELQQAGIFHVSDSNQNGLDRMLRILCPNTLFPYARSNISDLVTKGGFPTLDIAHVNFKTLYEEELGRKQASTQTYGSS